MKAKNHYKQLTEILRDFALSPEVLLVLSAITFLTDFSVSKPLYVLALDMGGMPGTFLALGMAGLFTALPKITAKLFVRKQYGLGALGILCGIGLMALVYVGQKEVAIQKANDPMGIILSEGFDEYATASAPATQAVLPPEPESHLHFIATGLLSVLFTCSLFLSYVFYHDEQAFKPVWKQLTLSKFLRVIEQKLIPLRGRCERAESSPRIAAEGRVNAKISELEERELRLQRELEVARAQQGFDNEALNNIRARIRTAIHFAYQY